MSSHHLRVQVSHNRHIYVLGTATAAFDRHNFLSQPAEGILASVGFIQYAIAAVRNVTSTSSVRSAVDTPSPIPSPPSFPPSSSSAPVRFDEVRSCYLLLISHQLLALLQFQCRKL